MSGDRRQSAAAVSRTPPRTLRANGVDLCVQVFGEEADPAVVLVGGAAASMDWWREGFCEAIARGGRRVVRYDLRDTGQSVTYPVGAPGYGGADLAGDVIGILDALGIARAHLVGISMGGGLVQGLALDHPGRVASITLMSTSPGGSDLPPTSPGLAQALAGLDRTPDWSDREAVVEYLLEGERAFAGGLGVDEAEVRALAATVLDRTRDLAASMTNHWILEGGPPTRPRLGGISAPALVFHGGDDPLFPPGHGEALAREIPGARLVVLDGVGHEMPPRAVWDVVVPAILAHTAPG